ncbi:hypothetical protein Ahy_A10g048489 [Arachis hypogaea]|uniref:Transposase, Ptta/En/Spm, plant n=1 Tax=Arachis hypogaea TaxID=3818 RepID=A0A445B5B4_ARAHY|nr:hypothetical protein Ahy_A10g048489 [Arachis hypogaea]
MGPGFQQPQTGATATSDSHHDGSQILPTSGDSVPASGDSVLTTSRPFRLPRSEPRPAPQMSTNSAQNSLPGHLNLDANANEVPLFDEEVDDLIDAFGAQSHRGRKTTEFWTVKIIGSIVLMFNNAKQAIGDEAGLLSGVLGLLGSDYEKFPIYRKNWRPITTRDKVYNECVKQIFYFDEDSEGTIKKNILKSMGKSWKETKMRLYDNFYEPTFTIEQNIEHRPLGIDREHWRWFLDYRTKVETKSEQQVRRVGRGELWITVHKKKDGSYINDEARAIGEKIKEIEKQDESSRMLSQNDSIAQVFGKEKPDRAKLEGEKLKRKAMEDEAAAEKKKRHTMESAMIYLFQRQGEELLPDIAAGMSNLE